MLFPLSVTSLFLQDMCSAVQMTAQKLVEPSAFLEKKDLLVANTVVSSDNIQFPIVNIQKGILQLTTTQQWPYYNQLA